MSIANLTDPAEVITTPDLSMFLRLEYPAANPARRISLSSLASLLAAGLLPNSTQMPAGTVLAPPAGFGQPSCAGRDDILEAAAQQLPSATL